MLRLKLRFVATQMHTPYQPIPEKSWMPALTGVRFFLALWVLLFHCCEEWQDYPLLFALFSKGYVAVSGFFVLSGMVLVHSNANKLHGPGAVKRFFQARFARLYPMYVVSIVLALPLFFWYQYQTNAAYLLTVPVVTLVTLLGIQSWYRGWVDALNPPSWSLSVEAFFYSVFPFLNKVFLRLKPRFVFILLLALALFNIFLINRFIDASTKNDAFNSFIHPSVFPLFHLATFIMGMCFGYLGFVHGRMQYTGGWVHLALPILLLMVFCMNLPQLSFVSINSGGYAVLFGVIFLMLAQPRHMLAKFLSLKWIVLLGESSYALYLLHIPVRTYLTLLLQKFQITVAAYPHMFLFIYAVVAVAVSVICFLYIERPLTKLLRKWLWGGAHNRMPVLQPYSVLPVK